MNISTVISLSRDDALPKRRSADAAEIRGSVAPHIAAHSIGATHSSMATSFNPDLLKGKVAFVTGGGSGICKGITLAFMQHGCACAILGRKLDRLKGATNLKGSLPAVDSLAPALLSQAPRLLRIPSRHLLCSSFRNIQRRRRS